MHECAHGGRVCISPSKSSLANSSRRLSSPYPSRTRQLPAAPRAALLVRQAQSRRCQGATPCTASLVHTVQRQQGPAPYAASLVRPVQRPQRQAQGRTSIRASSSSSSAYDASTPPSSPHAASLPMGALHPKQLTVLIASCNSLADLQRIVMQHEPRLNEIHVAAVFTKVAKLADVRGGGSGGSGPAGRSSSAAVSARSIIDRASHIIAARPSLLRSMQVRKSSVPAVYMGFGAKPAQLLPPTLLNCFCCSECAYAPAYCPLVCTLNAYCFCGACRRGSSATCSGPWDRFGMTPPATHPPPPPRWSRSPADGANPSGSRAWGEEEEEEEAPKPVSRCPPGTR